MTELSPIEIDPETFLYKHNTLPALPKILTSIQEIMYSDNISVKKIADLIRNDPSLVAQVLKLVNSAFYSLPNEIADVNLAVAYMGIHEVYRVILSFAVFKNLACEDKDEFNQIWFHSLYTALCAKYLSERYEPLLPGEELWSASILHDIGKIVYLKFFPDHYRTLQQYCKTHGCFFNEAEKQHQLPESGYIGTLLCNYWRLPDKIKNACQYHGLKDFLDIKGDSLTDAFTRIICMANLTALMTSGHLNKERKVQITKAINTTMNLKESDLMIIMGDIYDLRQKAEEFM